MAALDQLKAAMQPKPSDPVTEVAEGTANPANDVQQMSERRRHRVPMSTPVRKLQVDPIPGFHLHWFAEFKVSRAKQAGYVLVKQDEVFVNGSPIGADPELGGNTDLGSSVSIVASFDERNNPIRLVLMKLPEEFWQDDQAELNKRNLATMSDIFEGESIGLDSNGRVSGLPEQSYISTAQISKPILNRGMPKAKSVRGGRTKLRG